MWYALMAMRRDGQTLVVVADLRAPLRDWPLWAGETVEIEQARLGAAYRYRGEKKGGVTRYRVTPPAPLMCGVAAQT
jgi:hypothetical protein